MKMNKHAVLLSGGLDSTTLLGGVIQASKILPTADEAGIIAVSLKYPSKHNDLELASADDVCDHYDITHTIIDVTPVFDSFDSALLKDGEAIPEGHYESESMKRTVVPMRNLIFANIVAAHLITMYDGPWSFYLGIHAGDHAIYPDCRPDTFHAMAASIYHGSDKQVTPYAPYLQLTKSSIVKLGLENNVPYDLTRTCYTDGTFACGKCGSCTERLEAFAANGALDPLSYQ